MNNSLTVSETLYLAGFFSDSGTFLIKVVFNIIIILILVRFLLQVARADFYNPMSQTIVKMTSPLLRPFRKLVPGFGGIDLASIILLFLLELVKNTLILAVNSINTIPFTVVIINSLFMLMNTVIMIYILGIIVLVIASWIASGSYNPVLVLIEQLISPILKPVRRLMPNTHGIDFSPLVAMVVLALVQIALRHLNPYSQLIPLFE